MVQAVENWACVAGRVVSLRDTEPAPGVDAAVFAILSIAVERVSAVEGFRNLLTDFPGTTIAVRVRRAQIANIGSLVGRSFRVPVAVAGPATLFVHPGWTAASGSPLCP